MAAIVTRKGTAVAYVGTTEQLSASNKLAHVYSFDLPSAEADEVDVTDFDSEGKEFEMGMVDYGEVTITQNFASGDIYTTVQDWADNGTTVYFQLFLKDKTGAVVLGRKGTGVVKGITVEGVEAGGNKVTVQTTIRVSGKPVSVTVEPT